MGSERMDISCEEIRELEKENPEQAAVIIEMLKAAGEECTNTEEAVSTAEH